MAVSYIAIFALLASLAMVTDGRIFGHKITHLDEPEVITHAGASEIVNTTELCRNVQGYAGPVPVKIYITKNRIDSVVPLENNESPDFFRRLAEAAFWQRWNGKTLDEAAEMEVDAVTGATYSSTAAISNVRAGAAYAANKRSAAAGSGENSGADTAKWIVALVVILAGAILPLFVKNRRYRIVQQVLNVAVLGFWAGSFVDYAMMIGFFANGATGTLAAFVIIALLFVGLVYPLFGKHGFYCAWVCPYGSLQELAGKIPMRKWKMSTALVKKLDTFRQLLWSVLIILLFAGWGVEWMDHEIFTAFIVQSASWIVIIVGVLFVVLSIFVPRPFCRFVCPTGSLLKFL